MNRFLVGAVGAFALTTLTACGSSHTTNSAGNSSSPSASPTTGSNGGGSAADSVKASIKADILASESASPTNPFKMNDSQAGCVANTIVDSVGVDKLRAYGLLTADNKVTTKKVSATKFSVADATVIVNGIYQCVGDATMTTLMNHAISASLPATVTAAQRACIEGKVNAGAVKQVLIGQISGNAAAVTQLESSVAVCMTH